jgi:hypothetical protein
MKNIRYLFVIVIALMLHTSCSKDDVGDIDDPALIGTWETTIQLQNDTVYIETIIYNADLSGHAAGSWFINNKDTDSVYLEVTNIVVDQDFKWRTKKDILTLDPIEEGLIDTSWHYFILEDVLTIKSSEYEPLEYIKQ